MKLIVASDIHGSYFYTKKLEELIKKENPDKILLLGDILYHGARNALPCEYSTIDVIETLNQYADKIIAVRGNCDSEVDDMVAGFGLVADYEKIEVDGRTFYLTHGHLMNKYEELFKDHYVLSGHTHVYQMEGKNINPGSVGIPKVNKEHTCLVYENGEFQLINLDDFSVIKRKKLD